MIQVLAVTGGVLLLVLLAIVHCVAQVHTISNMLYDRFQLFFSKASSSSSSLIRSIITESGYHVNCFTGYNLHYGHSHVTIVTLIVLL